MIPRIETHRTNPIHRRNTFDIEEPNTKTKIWYHWFNTRFRQLMILEIFFIISLIMILYKLQTMSNQNDRVSEMVNSMQSQFDNMERKIELLVSQKPNQNISQSDNNKPLEKSNADVLNSMELPTQNSTEKMEPTVPQINQFVSQKANQGMSQLENAKLLEQSIVDVLKRMKFRTQVSTEQMQPIFPQVKQSILNVADFIKGASVDMDNSSSSSLNPRIGYDQTNLVLLDRPEPPLDKGWCTTKENPVLTINLAKYIKPISVSYQHAKWYGTIPNGAPKTYDVLGCLDCNGEDWEPLVSNCKYNQYISNKPEQMCNISSHQDFPIRKVQFRFRENYGDTKTTCVHLVRVYGETKTPVKIEKKNLKSEEICTDLRWYYHYNILGYTWTEKNCTVLYTNHCCSECPECCQECLITDYNKYSFAKFCQITAAVSVCLFFFNIML
ncbi:unnamed protein product [Caenorhabditis nigoni]